MWEAQHHQEFKGHILMIRKDHLMKPRICAHNISLNISIVQTMGLMDLTESVIEEIEIVETVEIEIVGIVNVTIDPVTEETDPACLLNILRMEQAAAALHPVESGHRNRLIIINTSTIALTKFGSSFSLCIVLILRHLWCKNALLLSFLNWL
jgi:hypothetical protein